MQSFTENRKTDTPDEIWLLQHEPVFTLGRNAKSEHILSASDIPMVTIDRGGQVTYHGPGQLIVYVLINLKRQSMGVRQLVSVLEQSIIDTLAEYQINAYAKKEAPGVYIEGAKIAAVGLRIKKGCSFHGLSFNLNMNLQPFKQINPCGYKDLQVIQLADFITQLEMPQIEQQLLRHLTKHLSYENIEYKNYL